MMLSITGVDRAERIAERAERLARERANNEWPDDWSSGRSFNDYVTMLCSIEAYTDGPAWAPTVEVRPRMRPDGHYWSGTAAEILDAAAGQIDTEAGDDFTFRHGMIEGIEDSYGAKLTWTSKPNLERALDEDPDVPAPMVEVRLDGRSYLLDCWAQGAAGDVALYHGERHGPYAGPSYARALLRLSADLRVDVETARRVAEAAAPDRNEAGIDVERNTLVRILSADEEIRVHVARSR